MRYLQTLRNFRNKWKDKLRLDESRCARRNIPGGTDFCSSFAPVPKPSFKRTCIRQAA